MSELKPCPFCGAEVQDDERGEKYPRKSPMGGWIIHCECCGASLSQFRKSGKGEISWNTRPIEDALNARIAELEAENAGLKERVAMLDVTAVFKSLGEMGYIEQTNKLHARIAKLEAALAEALPYEINEKIRKGEGTYIPLQESPEEREEWTN